MSRSISRNVRSGLLVSPSGQGKMCKKRRIGEVMKVKIDMSTEWATPIVWACLSHMVSDFLYCTSWYSCFLGHYQLVAALNHEAQPNAPLSPWSIHTGDRRRSVARSQQWWGRGIHFRWMIGRSAGPNGSTRWWKCGNVYVSELKLLGWLLWDPQDA